MYNIYFQQIITHFKELIEYSLSNLNWVLFRFVSQF